MKERPILFNDPMVCALLAGRKTQTRRVVIPVNPWHEGYLPTILERCPYGQPGDRLWVREAFAENIPGCPNGVSYRADHVDQLGDGPANPMKWKPSIHMPRWASRLTLEITRVWVERVQDISDEDAIAEGVDLRKSVTGGMFGTYRGSFSREWDSINAKRGLGWEANPWVWAIKFKLVEGVKQ